jgi:hypothetical protein
MYQALKNILMSWYTQKWFNVLRDNVLQRFGVYHVPLTIFKKLTLGLDEPKLSAASAWLQNYNEI